jgi:hypothetical protein
VWLYRSRGVSKLPYIYAHRYPTSNDTQMSQVPAALTTASCPLVHLGLVAPRLCCAFRQRLCQGVNLGELMAESRWV